MASVNLESITHYPPNSPGSKHRHDPTFNYFSAAVEKVYIVQGNASSSTSDQSTTPTITFVEGEPTPVRCIARGGSPPPEIEISIGRSDYTKYFRFDSVPAMSGDVGFRSLRMTTMLVTDNFRATADDDGKRLNCIAKVPGLTEVLKSIIVTVNCKYQDRIVVYLSHSLSI